jgi:endonuclease/exonuclease/phosphatase family metal-dependent hydrolase
MMVMVRKPTNTGHEAPDLKTLKRKETHKRRPWKRYAGYAWGTILTVITVPLVLLFLTAAFSDHVSPQKCLYLSYLGIGFPLIMTVTMIWCVVLLLLHRGWLFALTLLSLAIAYEPISRFLPLSFGSDRETTTAGADTATSAPQELTLLTYNTCRMGQTHLAERSQQIPVVKFLKESGADIVCLQEYGFSLSKAGHTERRIRADLAKEFPYYHYLPYNGVQSTGIALYSRYPIRKAQRIDASQHYMTAMCYRLDVKGHEVALINYHLHSNSIKPADRVFYGNMVEHFETDSIDRLHYNLIRQLGRAYLARAGQAKMVAEAREKLGAEIPILICGDMNDTPVSYCYHTVRGDLADTWVERGSGPGITFYKHKLWFRIDHIFHSQQFRPTDIHVVRSCHYSDHYPLIATFQLTTP